MTFTTILGETIRTKTLISVELNLEVIQSFFEDVCSKLDEIEGKVNGIESAQNSKADKADVNSQISKILERLDDGENNYALLADNVKSQKDEMQKWTKDIEERIEVDIGKCLIDCRNLTHNMVRECEPEIAKNVIASLPNLESLMEENNKKQEQIDSLMNELNDLKSRLAAIEGDERPSNTSEIPRKIDPMSNMAISDADLQAISDEINGRMNKELAKLNEAMKNYTDDQINGIFGRSDEQGKNLAIDIANAMKMARDAKESTENLSSSVNNKLQKTEENMNNLFTETQKAQAQFNNKLNDIGVANQQLNDKMAELQKMFDNVAKSIESQTANSKDLANMVIQDDGKIDLAPILRQLNGLGTNINLHNERIATLEEKDTVHPLAVSNLRDKLDILDQQVQNLTAKLGKFEADQLSAFDSIRHQEERINNCDTSITDLQTEEKKMKTSLESIRQAIENLTSRLTEMQNQNSDLASRVGEVESKQNTQRASKQFTQSKDQRVDSLIEMTRGLEKDLNATKGQLNAACASLDLLSARLSILSPSKKDPMLEMNEIQTEIKQIWAKIKELTDLQNDNKDDFIPKVDLSKPVQQKQTIVERTALPRIAFPKSPRGDDSRVNDTVMKVEKQEGLLYQMKRAIDQHQKSITSLDDNKADKQAAQMLFEQFRIALGELNNRIGSLKKAIVGKVDAADLTNYLNSVLGNGNDDETATGTEPIRCLSCGRPRRNVTGALDDPTLAKRLGGPVSTRVLGDGDGQVCFVYGERGDMYYGRSGTGKSIFSKPPAEQNSTV